MIAQEHIACLLLGSNIQPKSNLRRGVNLLRRRVKFIQFSSVWETPSVGRAGPNFLNLALLITTSLDAEALKVRCLRHIEALLGRVRSADKNAPRQIDIDIILFDGRLLDTKLWFYAYRAVPVAEILPDYCSDQGEPLKQIASRLAKTSPIHLKKDVRIDHRMNLN